MKQHWGIHGGISEDVHAKQSKESGDISVSTKSTKSVMKQMSIAQFSHEIALM